MESQHDFHSNLGYDPHRKWEEIQQEAKSNWLTPNKILFAILNTDLLNVQIRKSPITCPQNGDLVFYDREQTPSFKNDGLGWARKKNQDRLQETYDTFKLGGYELHRVNSRTSDNTNFQRRIYRIIKAADELQDRVNKTLTLVQYRVVGPSNTKDDSQVSHIHFFKHNCLIESYIIHCESTYIYSISNRNR